MNKKYLLLSLGLVSVMALAACGTEDNAPETSNAEETSQESKETVDTTQANVTEDDDADDEVSVDNDWEHQIGDTNDDGTIKLLMRNDTTDVLETGTMSLNLPQVTVSEIMEWSADLAEYYDFEPTGVIQIDMEVSNSSDDTINYYMDQATITTNTGEQLEPDLLSSDHIGGEFIGAVNKSGSVRYLLKDSNPNDVEWVRIIIDGPYDENLDAVGEDIDVQIDF
ncbi:hypothetical protein [Alkalicoccobacillus plakortidis]|uniref:DUF4352 domain-containing protein n=1 Tax=Alkalicoccobacillus plakortidis TaxID=444060 RepID=A0ABT0XFK5_9BACI|nr:hypothetical protein [Alkalicoccobacillus plakortidis]MCM2674565.1 hypothetical protein [Alkalicoccobacillus plakortidis]